MTRRDDFLRLKRFKVQELKRRMAALNGMRIDLTCKLADLEESVARERQRAGDTDIGRWAFPVFLQSIESRRTNICNSVQEVERERAHHESELAAAIQELRALEQALDHENIRTAEAEERRAQSRADEMALVRHLRKHALRQI